MAPRVSDSYSPVPSQGNSGNIQGYLTPAATPNAMGAGVGQAVQGLGQSINKVQETYTDYKVQEMGLANEHAYTEAEQQLVLRGGAIDDKLKSLTGLDATNSKDQIIQEYLDTNKQIRESLPNDAARRGYDQITRQRVGFTIQNMNSYATAQKKKAYRDGNVSSMALSVSRASKPEVAGNNAQFDLETANITFQLNATFSSPEYGDFHTVPAKEDPKTGRLVYDVTTEQGRIAQNTYDNEYNKNVGQAWKNRITTVAAGLEPNQGPVQAVELLKANKSRIPNETYADLSKMLAAPYKTYRNSQTANNTISQWEWKYQNSLKGGTSQELSEVITNSLPGSKVTSAYRDPEKNKAVGGAENSDHLRDDAIDFVAPAGTTEEQVRDILKSQGITPRYLKLEKEGKEGQHFHVSYTRNNSEVDAGTKYNNKADFYRANYPQILDQAYEESLAEHGDPLLADQARGLTQQRINNVINQQNMMTTAHRNTVLKFVTGGVDGKSPVTDMSQLETGPAHVRNAWHEYAADNPYAYPNMMKIIKAQSFPKQSGYGTNFYANSLKAITGEVTDPVAFGSELMPEEGANSPLTENGRNVLGAIIKDRSTPEGAEFWNETKDYIYRLQKEYVGTGFVPGATPYSTNSEWNKALREVMPRIMAGKARGLSAQQLFSPKINGKDNPDYIYPSVPAPSWSKLSQINIASFGSGTPTSAKPLTIDTIRTKEDLNKFAQTQGLTEQQYIKLYHEKGFSGK
jgi:hypothetical protein